MRLAVLCGLTVAAAFAPNAMAQAPARAPAAPTQQAPDPAMDAAQRAYDALPDNDRRAIQEALMWTGDYNAAVGVTFGKRLYDAIRAYQKRKNVPQTGTLSDALWAALLAEGKRARDSVRFATLDDPATGVRLGAPMRAVERSTRSPRGDATQTVQYQSADGVMMLGLISAPLAAKSLEQAFADETAARPGRKVTYKFQRPEFFVVSGEENGRVFYSRGARNSAQMRGFTFSYPMARKADFDRVMLAIANSFEPFPGAVQTASAPGPGPAPTPSSPPPRPLFAATGLVIAPGRALTSAAVLQSCPSPSVNGAAARAERVDAASGVAILAISGGRPAQVAVSLAALADNNAAVALSAAAGQAPQVASGQVRASGDAALFVAGLAGGAMGAPVFDRKGALIGLVAENPRSVTVASLAATPAVNHKLAPANRFASLLPAASAAGESLSAGAIAQRIAPSIVAIGCGS